ncbi:hypothetical protein IQ07DRAFT_669743 [Pyrenochaeta sp. DS3sAY3a]|nr:hypothetical protein IQ07DRAFT_669743 [Pyrenochaeta sp. DS3sAY3a]
MLSPPGLTNQENVVQPLTSTRDMKPFAEARNVVALFRRIEAGKDTEGETFDFQLDEGGFDQIQSLLEQDPVLWGFVDDKIRLISRYDYDEEKRRLLVRRYSAIHQSFVGAVDDEIRRQLNTIRSGTDRKARFAQKVHPMRSSTIRFAATASAPFSKSRYDPDASFKHANARYPGFIFEVSYSQKKGRVARLAENYILDSGTSVRVIVTMNIEYGEPQSRRASLSVWRPELVESEDGPELHVVEEVVDEAFRDDQGNPVEHAGLRLRRSEFAYEGLAQRELGDDDAEIRISGIQLCQYLDAAEEREQGAKSEDSIGNIRKRRQAPTPSRSEAVTSSDEGKYAEQEESCKSRRP